jgi:tryptophan halogenase
MEITETLKHRIELFKKTARVCITQSELFRIDSWTQVMIGQGIMPDNFHQIVDQMSDAELGKFLNGIKAQVNHRVDQLPSHQAFIDSYCKAEPI